MQHFVFLKINGDNWKINYSDIQYIEAVDKYVNIFIADAKKPYLLLFSMCQVEKLLPAVGFCRIHRSYIVSLQHITRFNNEFVYVAGKELAIGKHYKDNLEDKVTIWCTKNGAKLSGTDVDKFIQEL